MILFYIIAAIVAVALVGGLWCIATHAGEKEGLCKYDNRRKDD